MLKEVDRRHARLLIGPRVLQRRLAGLDQDILSEQLGAVHPHDLLGVAARQLDPDVVFVLFVSHEPAFPRTPCD